MYKLKIKEENRQVEIHVSDGVPSSLQIELVPLEEKVLLTSSKFRTRLKNAIASLYIDFRSQTRVYVRAILHNTANTESLIRQTVERYTRIIPYHTSYAERVDSFTKMIADDPRKFAEAFLFIEQRATDLDAQIIGMNVLIGKEYTPQLEVHPLLAVLWRSITPFKEIFKAHSIYINFQNLSEKTNIKVDFRLFSCGMYHFFDNIQKYIKPDSLLDISVDTTKQELLFTMVSRSLDEDEKTRIFEESYSGRTAGSQKGEGFGMYIFKQVLSKMDAIPDVRWREQAHIIFEGNRYREQVFIVKFAPNTLF